MRHYEAFGKFFGSVIRHTGLVRYMPLMKGIYQTNILTMQLSF